MRFQLIDRIVEIDVGQRIRAEAAFDPEEELFADHFPGRPLVPGSLLIETMAQAGGWLVLATDRFRRWPLLVLVERAKFREPTPPGAVLTLEAELAGDVSHGIRGPTVRLPATARADGRLVAQATCVYRLFEPDELAPGQGAELRRWVETAYSALRPDDASAAT